MLHVQERHAATTVPVVSRFPYDIIMLAQRIREELGHIISHVDFWTFYDQ